MAAVIMTPLIFCLVLWFLVIKNIFDNPDLNNESRPTHGQLHVILFFGIMEYLSLQQVPAGCIYRVQDKESKISDLMYSSQGSRAAYALAGITFDWMERVIIFSPLLILMKLFILGNPVPELVDFQVGFCFSIYDLTKVLINFHTVSYFFDKKELVIKLSGLFSALLYSVQASIAMSTFGNFEEQSTANKIVARLSFIRTSFNMLFPLIPSGNPKIEKMKEVNEHHYGGPLNNFLLMLAHLTFAILLVLFIDSRSNKIKQVNQKKKLPFTSEVDDIKNKEELQAEEEATSKLSSKVTVHKLEKAYPKCYGAYNVSFAIENKQIFTILGPNGAGKSSTLEVLSGVSNRTEGKITYEKQSIEDYNNKNLSFCLQKNYLWEYLTFREHLEIVGRWRGIDEMALHDLIQEIDRALQLEKSLDIKAGELSLGNKRKLNTVLALMASPQILILDEPTEGMDPLSRR